MSSTTTVRLDDEAKARLEQPANATDGSRSGLAAEAIRESLANHEWQIREISSALREADAGDFAGSAESDFRAPSQ